jgi:predicted HTH domain antitoxin
MSIVISDELLRAAVYTEQDFRIELAVHLYDLERLSMGQARNFAGLDQISFQRELARRGVYIKYGEEQLEEDLKAIEEMKQLR